MDGERIKWYLRSQGITQEKAAELLAISRQTLTIWLGREKWDAEKRDLAIASFDLPDDFFDRASGVVNEPSTWHRTPLVECEKKLAAANATISQLEIRLKEKDRMITLLSK